MEINKAYATRQAIERIQAAFEAAVRKEIDAGNLNEVDETVNGHHYDTVSLFSEVENALEGYFDKPLREAHKAIEEYEAEESYEYQRQVHSDWMWSTRP